LAFVTCKLAIAYTNYSQLAMANDVAFSQNNLKIDRIVYLKRKLKGTLVY